MRSTIAGRRRLSRMRKMLLLLSSALAVAAVAVAGAQAKAAAAPQSSSAPTITGRLQQGHTLTAHNGNWSNSPTGFTYQWQQCDSSGANCNSISGATSRNYTAASGDVDHTLKVVVSASNSDGSSSATSQADERDLVDFGAGEHRRPAGDGHGQGRRAAERQPGHVDRWSDLVRLPVAAL